MSSPGKSSFDKDQLNIRVKKSTKQFLEEWAEKRNLTFGDKGSISELLDEIGDKKLSLIPVPQNIPIDLSDSYNVNFEFTVDDFPGALHHICQIMYNFNSDIIGLDASSPGEFGYLDLVVRLPEDVHPKQILDAADRLIIEDVWPFVNPEKRKEDEKNKKLVINMKCSISIEIEAMSRIGLLADLTGTIARKKINLISAFRKIDNGTQSISHFHVEWTDREGMDSLIKSLQEVPSVQKVSQIDVDTVFKHFTNIRRTERSEMQNKMLSLLEEDTE